MAPRGEVAQPWLPAKGQLVVLLELHPMDAYYSYYQRAGLPALGYAVGPGLCPRLWAGWVTAGFYTAGNAEGQEYHYFAGARFRPATEEDEAAYALAGSAGLR